MKTKISKLLAFLLALALLTLAACSKDNLTTEDAGKILSTYLMDNYGFVEGSDYLESGGESRVFDVDCYAFDWRYGPQAVGIQDRLAGNYAISTDGNRLFYYDRGEDAWYEYRTN
jgi:ABC-type oligopeptide transport system substrate-binding subunit